MNMSIDPATSSSENTAAIKVQNLWRRCRAIKNFRSTLNAATWNVLDNHEEQLNLKRATQLKAAEHTIALLAKQVNLTKQDSTKSLNKMRVSMEETISNEYTGPHVSWPLLLPNVLQVLHSFKSAQVLHHQYVAQVLVRARKMFSTVPTLQEIHIGENEKMTLVGDLHGQLEDLYTIFTINGLPSLTNKYLFNGDFVDRGKCGAEVVMTILLFKLLYPEGVFLNRGNHESRNQNSWMGFEDEIWEKYDGSEEGEINRATKVCGLFQTLFDYLPLCAIIQKKIFVVHGGLTSRDGVTLKHLRGISRKREPPLHQQGFEDQIFEDLLWSDPRSISGRQPSERGAGVEFGVDVTNNFCGVNRVALIVRSHECVPEGFEVVHGGRLITLFSASRYCGTQTNKGSFLTLGMDLQPEIQQFYAHPMSEISDFRDPTASKPPKPSLHRNDSHIQEHLEDDNIRMIAERICDNRSSLLWYFTQQDTDKTGCVPRLVWAEALKSVLQLDISFLNYSHQLADVQDDTHRSINYSKFLARYRIENSFMRESGWAESLIANICKKIYTAMGAGSMEQAFELFDTDANGFIEYDEFMNTLKTLDTGLSDSQVVDLMQVADTNDDGRIDFREFVSRFEVIFRDLKVEHHATALLEGMDIDDENGAHKKPKTTWGAMSPSNHELPQRAMNPVAIESLDAETMTALLQIGRLMFVPHRSLLDWFQTFDTNRDGVLQESEFVAAVEQLGLALDASVVKRVMQAVDVDGGNTIDYREFLNAFGVQDLKEPRELELGKTTWQQSVLHQMSNVFYQHRIHLRTAFRMFDTDRTGDLNIDEFRSGISIFNSLLNSPLSGEQIEELLVVLDKNGDGVLSYTEFFDGFRVIDARK